MKTSLTCIVLCAGKGTRMKSEVPKVLHHILGKPMVTYPTECAFALGANPVVAVVGHQAERVEQTLRTYFPDGLLCALQAEQKGTGHAVQMAMEALPQDWESESVLVLYGDTPLLQHASLASLVQLQKETKAELALLTTQVADPTGYGRIVRDADGRVARIVEHKDASAAEREIHEINPGIYVMDAAFLRAGLAQLSSDNAQGELYLTDLVAMAASAGRVVDVAVDAEDTLGVNDRLQLAQAAGILQKRINDSAMRQGVTLEDPKSTFIEPNVQLGQDVVIGPNVSLRGQSVIGDGAEIEQGVILYNTHVESGARIRAYSICEDAHVGPQAEVGPFARLRPEAVLLQKSKVGNFVEVKKTRLGEGAKANHLAYLGDADIGAGSNIGAGTITCNYDGHGKHKTTLGEGVFIGSNSTLVAPVQIHAGAYVAADSCVTREVPADALAISRTKQENKEGYAARLRARNAARANKKVK